MANQAYKEIIVISGKGGTGKTSLCAAFASLAENAVLCDLDVDVPDLHIILNPVSMDGKEPHPFTGGSKAVITPETCIQCGKCMELCRYDAVVEDDGQPRIDQVACEGCGVCAALCPTSSIEMKESLCGTWDIGATRFGPFVHATLLPGQENSGKLVSLLKQEARNLASRMGRTILLCDGSPGTGCPVISSLSGASLAVAVIEPTPSGLHDFQRTAGVCAHFRVPVGIVINKADLNPQAAAEAEDWCRENGHAIFGRVPFDPAITASAVQGLAVTEMGGPAADAIRGIWQRIDDFQAKPTLQLLKK